MPQRRGVSQVTVGERQVAFRGGGSTGVASAPGAWGQRAFGSVLSQLQGPLEQIGGQLAAEQAKVAEQKSADAGEIYGATTDIADIQLPTGNSVGETAYRRSAILSASLQAEVLARQDIETTAKTLPGKPEEFRKALTANADKFLGGLPEWARGPAAKAYAEYGERKYLELDEQRRQLGADQAGAAALQAHQMYTNDAAHLARQGDWQGAFDKIHQLAEFNDAAGPVAQGGAGALSLMQIETMSQKAMGQIQDAYLTGWVERQKNPRAALKGLQSGKTGDPVTDQVLQASDQQSIDHMARELESNIKQQEAEAKQAAAIARQEAMFEAQGVLQDELAAAADGNTANPSWRSVLTKAYGDKAASMIDRVERTRETAATAKEFATATPEEIAAAVQGVAPIGAGQGSAAPTGPVAGLMEPGNIDLTKRPQVKNADGSVSTVRSMSFEEDGKEVLIPTVSPDGKILSDADAIKLYRETGQHLGKFGSAAEADAYAQNLHKAQEGYYSAGTPGVAQGGAGYEAQAKLHEALTKVAQDTLERRVKDPAGEAMKAFPSISAGFASKDPAQISAAMRESVRVQKEVFGLQDSQIKILPPAAVGQVVDAFKAAPTADERLSVLRTYTSLGDDEMSRRVLGQLEDKGLPPSARFAMEALNEDGEPTRARAIMGGIAVDPKDLPKLGDGKDKDATAAVDAVMAGSGPASISTRTANLSQEPGMFQRAAGERETLLRMTRQYVAGGMEPEEAAAKAESILYGGRGVAGSDDLGHVRAPAGVDPAALTSGLEVARASLDIGYMGPKPSGNPAQDALAQRDWQRYTDDIRSGGIWVEAEGGYSLMDPSGALVRDPADPHKPRVWTADELVKGGVERDSKSPMRGRASFGTFG